MAVLELETIITATTIIVMTIVAIVQTIQNQSGNGTNAHSVMGKVPSSKTLLFQLMEKIIKFTVLSVDAIIGHQQAIAT